MVKALTQKFTPELTMGHAVHADVLDEIAVAGQATELPLGDYGCAAKTGLRLCQARQSCAVG